MWTNSGYRQLWHLYAQGWGYCALGTIPVDGIKPHYRRIYQRLPLRDRYAESKATHALLTYIQVVGEAPSAAAAYERQRLLYFIYQPWSTTTAAAPARNAAPDLARQAA